MGHIKQTHTNHTNNTRNSKQVTLKSYTKYSCTWWNNSLASGMQVQSKSWENVEKERESE
jgi:hypothetical protein